MPQRKPCGQGVRCADPDVDAAGNEVARWGPGPFCARDTQLINGALAELPTLYVELHIEMGRLSSGRGEPRVSGTAEPPSPIKLNVDALLRELHQVLASWHEVTLDTMGKSPLRQQRAGVEVDRASWFLRSQLGTLLRLPATALVRPRGIVELDGVRAGLELLELRRRAHVLLGRVQRIQFRAAPCPGCSAYALTHDEGNGLTTCEACHRRLDQREYEAWCEQLTTRVP